MSAPLETIHDAAQRLGLTVDALRSWCKSRGHLRHPRPAVEWDALRREVRRALPPRTTRALVLLAMRDAPATARDMERRFSFLSLHSACRTIRRLRDEGLVGFAGQVHVRGAGRKPIAYLTTAKGRAWLASEVGVRALRATAPLHGMTDRPPARRKTAA